MSGDPVPAITEAAATGEIAALYDDIRRSLGVPVVNLVWRHLATLPGALAWAWGTVRPVYVDGSASALAAAFRAGLALPPLPRLSIDVLQSAGVDAKSMDAISGILASYDRSNTTNLIALSALLARLDGETGEPAAIQPSPEPPLDLVLPKLLGAAEMAPATWALVTRLNLIGERDGRIVASMYRHLAHWPAFLALAWTLLAQLAEAGALVPAIETNLAAARQSARALVPRLAALPVPLPDQAPARAAIQIFVEHPIGKMVTICRLLRRSLPATGA